MSFKSNPRATSAHSVVQFSADNKPFSRLMGVNTGAGTYGHIYLTLDDRPGAMYLQMNNVDEVTWWMEFLRAYGDTKDLYFVPKPDMEQTGLPFVPPEITMDGLTRFEPYPHRTHDSNESE